MALMIGGQARAILWAQARALANYYFRRNRGPWLFLSASAVLVWYGLWVFGALAVALIAADPASTETVAEALPAGLLLVFCYWQIVPVIMVSSGLSLDLARLLVYPIPHVHLFGIEVMLRITTAVEMVIVCVGLGTGLALNPQLPWWSPLALIPFAAFNLLVATGLRDLFSRLMARKYFREALVFGLVLLAAMPQLLLVTDNQEGFARVSAATSHAMWPWTATAMLNSGRANIAATFAMAAWTALAWIFGRRQFERSLRFDAAAARASRRGDRGHGGVLEILTWIPNALFRDPLAAMVEKEIRSLGRAPRFRLLFLMGFSFGLLIWLPLAMRADPDSTLRTNYLTVVSAYALMLLGEAAFWNSFGMDRAAAQTYFVTPVRVPTVLVAKNIAATLFIAAEIGMVAFFCLLLRMPVTLAAIGEAFAVTAVLALFLFAVGNLLSVRYARGVDPAQSWRTGSAGRVQAYLLLLYPTVGAPVFLAYGARYAFEHDSAFYAVLLVDLLIGAILYPIALDSAAKTALARKEDLVQALSTNEGPVGG